MNLRTKLVALLLTVAVVPIVALSYLAFTSSRGALSDYIESSLATGVENAMGGLESRLAGAQNDLVTWASLGKMQDLLTSDEDGEISVELSRFLKNYPLFRELFAVDSEGKVVSTTREQRQGMDLKAHPLFTKVQKDTSYQSAVLTSGLVEQPGLLLAVPVRADYDPETIIGALVGVIDWGQIQTQLSTVAIAGGAQEVSRRLLLLAGDGRLLYDSINPDLRRADPELAALGDDPGVRKLKVSGTVNLIASVPSQGQAGLSDPNWSLHGLITTETAYASVNGLGRQFALLGALFIILATIVGLAGAALSVAFGRFQMLLGGCARLPRETAT